MTVVVVGAGQAGVQAAASLRGNGYPGRITLVGDEPGEPYQRPPLSKAYLEGTVGPERLTLRGSAFFAKNEIDVLPGRVTSIDRERNQVRLVDGEELGYGHLVLATGARNRELPIPGARLDGVLGLRTRGDADALRERLRAADDIVVIGAGFIGLEFAAVAAKLGRFVTIVETVDRVLARVVSPAVSAHYAALHEAHGNRIMSGRSVTRLRGDSSVTGVELSDGTVLPADLVVVGIGVRPNVELAAEAGLAVDNGILVDSGLSTSDPDISAIGDCAAYPSRFAPEPVRLESVQNAVDHARCLADKLTGGSAPYACVPWFWSDQFDAKLQIAGLATGYDRAIVQGEPGAFSVFCFQGDDLRAVESVNRPADHMAARRLFTAGATLHPDDIGDGFELKRHLASAG
ncbi:MAG TPA: FAD-dependent oxidoreductase [Amycolatopsis sp.]|nr:FAD-dependent oxidoreductase [Amycolatopsis sp.]